MALLSLGLVAACMSPRYPSPGEPLALAANEALVMGELRVRADGLEVGPGHRTPAELLLSPFDPNVKLSLFHVERSKRALYVRVQDDGTFGWVLPRGTYLIYVTPPGPPARNVVVAAFQIPSGARYVSIGRLVLDTAMISDSAEARVDYDVVDASVEPLSDEARRAQDHPDLEGGPLRNSMIVDSALFCLFDNYSRSRCEKVLERHGLSPGSPR